jgi:hypothetical protein
VWLNFQVLYLTHCHQLIDAATLVMLSRAVHGGQRCARVIAHASALNFLLGLPTVTLTSVYAL